MGFRTRKFNCPDVDSIAFQSLVYTRVINQNGKTLARSLIMTKNRTKVFFISFFLLIAMCLRLRGIFVPKFVSEREGPPQGMLLNSPLLPNPRVCYSGHSRPPAWIEWCFHRLLSVARLMLPSPSHRQLQLRLCLITRRASLPEQSLRTWNIVATKEPLQTVVPRLPRITPSIFTVLLSTPIPVSPCNAPIHPVFPPLGTTLSQ